jgi:putative transposase
MPLAKAMQMLKGRVFSLDERISHEGFSWQEGYGAFRLGVSQKSRTVDYIKRQAEHHRRRSFEHEFLVFLKMHAIKRSEIRLGANRTASESGAGAALCRPAL